MLQRVVDESAESGVKNEKSFLSWSIAGFFLLNCCNFLLRPLRDETGMEIGTHQLQWLFTGTFVALLLFSIGFAFLKNSIPLRSLLNGIYILSVIAIFMYFSFYKSLNNWAGIRWVFFIGAGVFNLFSISLYWSLLVEMLDQAGATRMFGKVAAGGSLGAIAGSFLATWVSFWFGAWWLLLVAAIALVAFLIFQNKMLQLLPSKPMTRNDFSLFRFFQPFRSSFFSAMALSNFIYAIMNTFLYYEQLALVENSATLQKTTLLAIIAAAINIATLVLQLFFFSKWTAKIKTSVLFTAVPLLTIVTFLWLIWQPSILLLILSTIIHRAGNYAIIKPLREVFFTNIESDAKFGTKNFVDTTFSRGGDLTGSWWYSCLLEGLYSKALIFLSVISLGTIWVLNSRQLAKKHYD